MKVSFQRIALLSLLLPLWACNADASNTQSSNAAVKKQFELRFPDRKVSEVKPAPIKGLYEVVVQMNQGAGAPAYTIVYTDVNVDYLMVGDLIDAKKKVSLTEARVDALNKVVFDYKALPFEKALKEVRGKGTRQVVVFSDPDCPYCKHLEETLSKIDNVTIYTFLYPLTQLHPDAMRKAEAIWCNANPTKTWNAFMRNNVAIPVSAPCKTPLADIQVLGQKLGVNGTPALIFSNGDIVSGAIPQAEIEKRLGK